MPTEPPGTRFLREFIETLSSVQDVDPNTASLLKELYDRGEWRSSDIVRALRASREPTTHRDQDSQA
jgi:hypothetical protein